MIPRLRTIAILMLLAGLSLGIFTSRALRAFGEADAPLRTDGRTPRIELLVDLYQRDYHLSDERADQVRQTLYGYDRAVDALIWELRQRYADEFQALFDTAEVRILDIFMETNEGR